MQKGIVKLMDHEPTVPHYVGARTSFEHPLLYSLTYS